MKKELKEMLPLNLQFFAEGGDDDGSGSAGGDDDNNAGADDNGSDNNNSTKTFTQEEVNSISANEKRQGKASVLKALGVKSEAEAKKIIDAYNAMMNISNQSGNNSGEDDKQSEAEERALKAEQKLSAVMAGVDASSIDDVIAIATLKVTDDKDLDTVLKEMKEDKRYSSFFGTSGNGAGTGSGVEHGNSSKGAKVGDFGRKLAEARASSTSKSSYFKR